MRQSLAIASPLCVLLLAGCSGMPVTTTTNLPINSGRGASFRGIVHGGQQPIAGAHVYLYGVNDTGYGQPAVSLLTSNSGTSQDGGGNYYVTTDSNGNWSVNGDYTCPAIDSYPYTYVLAVGGSAGSGNNPAIALLAPVGSCTQSNYTSTYTVVNEVSTIGLIYAGAGFIVDPTHVSGPNNTMANTGLSNVNTYNLYTQSTGVAFATTPAGNGTVPQAEIDTLANILAACVNSTGSSSSQCATLFSNAMNGSTTPTDTATAAVNIAHNPGANVASLFALQGATPPFQPALSAAPNDFTLAISFTAANMGTPEELAIDSSGNVWVSNNPGGAGLTNNFLFEFGSDGTLLSGANGYTGGGLSYPGGLAIDGNGNVWLANGGNSVSEFNSSGTAKSGPSGYTGSGMDDPWQIAIDASNNAWSSNFLSAYITKISPTGVILSGSAGYTGSGFSDPFYIAIDTSGNAWISDDTFLDELSPAGSVLSGSDGFSGAGLNEPGQIAIDSVGNVWAPNAGGGSGTSISKLSPAGAAISGPGGYTGGGLNAPQYLAIDANGNVWVANTIGNSISEFNSSGTAITGSNGFLAGLNSPDSVAIDSTGDVWVSDAGNARIVEFVGLASPVVTPIVANLQPPYGAAAVNKP